MADTLYFVIPCYNEEEVLPETAKRLKEKVASLREKGKVSGLSRIVFVNDGSKDRTWEMICELHEQDPVFSGICLSRNRGHQNALLAGLMTVRDYADFAVSMDADLQDDVDAVDEMIDKYYAGKDIVYGVRSARQTDTFFKRTTAHGFYSLMKGMGAETVADHADFRLMSARALDALSGFTEVNLFLRGIVPMLGFPTDVVYYERHERFAGESKYPLKKMLSFAVQGITSLSTKPLQMITRRDDRRLDVPHDLPVGDRRPDPLKPRRHRRVRRQDLPREQGAPALHHPGVSGQRARLCGGR